MNELTNTTEPQIAYSECYAQVFLGDCLELYKNIEPKSIDLILTDLPYGTTACKWDTIIPFDKLWEMVNYLLKPNGAFITTASQPFTSALVMSNPKMFKYEWIWIKNNATNFMNGKKQPMKKTENVVVFYKSQCCYNPQMIERVKEKNGISAYERHKKQNVSLITKGKDHYNQRLLYKNKDLNGKLKYPHNYLYFEISNNSNEKKAGGHPTQKPISLFEYLLKTYSNEGMTIFDPCMGSGTTGIACKNLNRNFIGIEKDETYFKIAEQRINVRTLFS